MIEFDYVIEATGGSTIPKGLNHEQIRKWEELRRLSLDDPAEPNEIAAFFKEYGLMSKKRQDWIEDYRHYKKFRENRRPEVFRERYE